MLLCESHSTQLRLTSAVGQSVHGIAFVAQTLKTTGGVHARVITCTLKKTLIYICNQNQVDDIIAEQSVAILINRNFPPKKHTFSYSVKCDCATSGKMPAFDSNYR